MPELVHFLEDHLFWISFVVLLYGALRCPPRSKVNIKVNEKPITRL